MNRRPSPSTFVVLALACFVAFVGLLVAAYGWDSARRLDATALHGFIDLQSPAVKSLIDAVAALGDPRPVGLMAAGLAVLGLARGRPRLALAVIALLAATSVSSQVLKAVLAYPRHDGLVQGVHVTPAAFPSGHATAAMSIALAGVLVAPARARPLAAALGAALALAVSFAVVALGWHFPSDVVGGFLLATGWALVIGAALLAARERWPERSARNRAISALRTAVDLTTTAGLALAALALAVALAPFAGELLARLPEAAGFAEDHTAVVAVALGVTLAAGALLGVVTAALRRP